MTYFPSLPSDAGVPQIYKSLSSTYIHWIRMGDEVMSKESELSQGERELIAVYVSTLNDCAYCRAAHLPSMALHGIEQARVDDLIEDLEGADVEPKWRALFRYIEKLTLEPSCLCESDAKEVLNAGWSESAFHTAIGVTCRFNFMNRLVMGFGLTPPEKAQADKIAERRLDHGYAQMQGELTRKSVE